MDASVERRYRPETRLVHAGTHALAVRRDVGGAVPHPGLRLRQRRAVRGALQGRGAGLPLFALLQSDGRDVRGAHGRVRRRRGRARDRDRHGGGDDGADRPAQGRRSRGRRQGAVRLVPLRGRGFPAALRRRLDAGRRHRSRPVAQGGAAQHQGVLPREPDQSDARSASTSPRSPRSPTRPARRWWSTTCSRRRSGRARSRSAPIASSIRRPSTSTGRAAVSAASSWRRRNSSRTTSTAAAPDRPVDVAVQRLGAAEGPGDAAPCACARQTETAATIADRAGRPSEDHAADLSGPADHPQAATGQEADARRLDPGRVRGRGRQGRRPSASSMR